MTQVIQCKHTHFQKNDNSFPFYVANSESLYWSFLVMCIFCKIELFYPLQFKLWGNDFWQHYFSFVTISRAEAETKAKLEKVAEIKKINAQIMLIRRWEILLYQAFDAFRNVYWPPLGVIESCAVSASGQCCKWVLSNSDSMLHRASSSGHIWSTRDENQLTCAVTHSLERV